MVKQIFGWMALIAFAQAAQAAPAVDRELVNFARAQGVASKTVRIVALLDAGRAESAPRRYDHRNVMRFLRMRSQASRDVMVRHLQNVQDGSQVRVAAFHWINNSLVADVTPAGLKALAKAPNVERIYLNRKIDDVHPVARRPVSRDLAMGIAGRSWPYSLKDIGIDRLAEEQPGVDGSGVVIGSVDTGIAGKHPALQGKLGLFFDAAKGQRVEPFDADLHGTHTAGTMVGGDRKDVKIGVAPGAKLVGTAALSDYDSMLVGMEFMLDPDGNPETPDFPRAINNSWNCNGAPDLELFYRAINSWEAAGILPVFSAGNLGPRDETITKPHEHPSVIAVAATGAGGKVTRFSSRGPAKYKGQTMEKPDISAPGDNIVSTVPSGRLEAMSGTSMAAPHVTGVSALLFQVNPKLTPAQAREILFKSAMFVDLGGNSIDKPVWNKAYGLGRLNAYAAVKMAAQAGEVLRRATRTMTRIQPTELFMAAFRDEPSAKAIDFGDNDVRVETQGNPNWVSAWDVWADY